VAHMNPLNVLRAAEVMRPVEASADGPQHGFWNGGAAPVELARAGEAPPGVPLLVAPETPVRALIGARLRHPGPFLVEDGGAIVGTIEDADLFRCLTRQG